NTGYDFAGLLCGSEGTLGLVTAVRLRLVAPTGPVATALVGFSSVAAAITAASALRRSLANVEAVELMLPAGLRLVQDAFELPAPFRTPAAAVLLVEASALDAPDTCLGDAVAGLEGVVDAAVGLDAPRRQQLWRYREAHTDAISRLGPAHKLDVTLPAAALPHFVDGVEALVTRVAPEAQTWCFGHAADGNVHVNVTGLSASDERVDDAVLRAVADLGGSISAEHGIGRAKRRWLHLARSGVEITAMRSIRAACDPDGICNPGVLLPPEM
ncbi:MAG: FAD-linked oxidase C-terminal domain-containing protein, partial [Aquihabitans sp.]